MDRGDVMSGIDPLNMAPSHNKDDVIRKERQKLNSCYIFCSAYETFKDLGN